MSDNIRKLPENIVGKDYVVGDLHGCLSLLQRLLKEVEFDQDRDRLFSVGDLIDRGPDSLGCLQLLAQPWFYAVQGNHENMLLNFFLPYLQGGRIKNMNDVNKTDFLFNGGDWVEQYFLPDQQRMTPEFNQGLLRTIDLPLLWIIGEGENRFHIIHAELVKSGYKNLKIPVWRDTEIDQWLDQQILPDNVEERLAWALSIMSCQELPALQEGLSPTFCGHTYSPKPQQVLSHINLDTGAFLTQSDYPNGSSKKHSLTLFDVKGNCWFSGSYQRERVIREGFTVWAEV